ncbi:MAG: MFS transporter [Pseudomonadota bacterium]
MTDAASATHWSGADNRALIAVAIHFVINGAVLASWLPRLPEIRDVLDVSLATVGQAIMLAGLAGFFASAVADRVIRAFGTRRVMIVGTALLVCCLPGVALASSVWVLVFVLACLTACDVLIDIAMNMQGSALSARRSTPVMNRLHAMWSVGTLLAGGIAAALAAQSVPLIWHLVGAAVVMLAALSWTAKHVLRADKAAAGDETASRSIGRTMWLFALIGGAAIVPEMTATDWASFRLHDDLGVALGPASMGFVAFTGCMVGARLFGDFVQQRFGPTQTLNGACVIALFGCLLAALVPNPIVSCVGFGLSGIGISVLFPAIYDSAAQHPVRPGAALGAMSAGMRLGAVFTPFAVGSLADLGGNVGVAMVAVVLPALVAVWWSSREQAV